MIVDERALVAAVRELAARDEGFVYKQRDGAGGKKCLYVHRTDEGHLVGGCIVGQAALKVGVPIEKLREFDSYNEGAVGSAFTEFSISPEVLNWLTVVQQRQDNGNTWGSAVDTADRRVGDPFA